MLNKKQPSDYDHTLAEARAVCLAVHGEDGCFGISYMERNLISKDIVAVKHGYGTFAEQEPTLAEYAKAGFEPYMMVAATTASGQSRSLVKESWAVAADFDDGLPELFESNEFVRPSILISTSPGRYHAAWVFDSSHTSTQMEFIASIIQDRFDADAGFARSNQMIRLPGFINHKNGHKVRLVTSPLSGKQYSSDLLCQAFDALLVMNRLRKTNHRLDHNLTISRQHHSADDMIEDAKSALEYVSELADDYSGWIKIGLALAGLGDAGLPLFHAFSSRSSKYDQDETEKKWRSLLSSADISSIRSLFSMAQRAGWKNQGFRIQDPAVGVLTDRQFGVMCAGVMEDEFAVIEHSSVKGPPQFLKQDGGIYRALSDIEKRNEVERVAKAVIAKLSGDKMEVGFKSTWLKKIGTNKGLNDLCEHIADVLILTHKDNKVQSFPYFPVAEGVLNMLSRELVPQRYKALPIYSTDVCFDPTAAAPLFQRVVNEIFEEDEEVLRFIFQLFGLILLGKPEQYFFVWLGATANNGKSLLVKTLKGILGPYFTFLPTASLMQKSHTSDGANPAIAQLATKRLAVVSEPTAKQTLDASLIKQLTGDGHINVRDNYGSPKDVAVEAVLLMVANYMPAARDDDNGLWRRAIVVPFNRTFTPEEDDKNLPTKLAKEKSGILNMMLDGAHDYLLNGLIVPAKIRNFVALQRHEVDPFEAFATDCLITSPGNTCALKEIYAAYVEWSKQNPRLRRLTKPEISKRLEKVYKKRVSGNLPVFDGVDVLSS